MVSEGFVSFESVLERVNRDKPENITYRIADAKEWTWEAVKKIGSESAYNRGEVELKVENGKALIPAHIQAIRTIRGENGEVFAQTYDSLDDDIYEVEKYLINGRYVFTNYTGSILRAETLEFPIDADGSPRIQNNVYVIAAVQAYILERITRKAWMTNKISDRVYMALEKEWLFYVRAASISTNMPSMDSMEDWRVLHNMIPGINENYQVRNKTNKMSGANAYVEQLKP